MKAEMKKKCWSMAEIGEAEWDLCDKDNILKNENSNQQIKSSNAYL